MTEQNNILIEPISCYNCIHQQVCKLYNTVAETCIPFMDWDDEGGALWLNKLNQHLAGRCRFWERRPQKV